MQSRKMNKVGLWLASLLLPALIMWGFVPTLSASPSPRIIQYRTLTMPFPPAPSLLQSKLEEFGAEGWELVFVIAQSGTLIFKRS